MENWPQRLARILHNLAVYIVSIPIDIYLNNWANVITLFENFFRRYYLQVFFKKILLRNSTKSRKLINTFIKFLFI